MKRRVRHCENQGKLCLGTSLCAMGESGPRSADALGPHRGCPALWLGGAGVEARAGGGRACRWLDPEPWSWGWADAGIFWMFRAEGRRVYRTC